jgi:hypothetical protein
MLNQGIRFMCFSAFTVPQTYLRDREDQEPHVKTYCLNTRQHKWYLSDADEWNEDNQTPNLNDGEQQEQWKWIENQNWKLRIEYGGWTM